MTETSFNHTRFRRRGSIAILQLDEPGSLNAISEAMRDEIFGLLTVVDLDPTLRVLILTGTEVFSSGADLREFGRTPSLHIGRFVRAERNIYRRVLSLSCPTVAAVTSIAFGGGLELALACDVRLGLANARLCLPEVRRGFIPGGGGTQLIQKRGGIRVRSDLALTGREISAQESFDLGFLHEVLSELPNLEQRVWEVAESLAQIEPALMISVRRALALSSEVPFEAGLLLDSCLALKHSRRGLGSSCGEISM